MTPEEFCEEMRKISEITDIEISHSDADDLMIELLKSLGYEKGCDIFDKMKKWYA